MSAPLIVFKAINAASDQQVLFQKVLADHETLSLRDKDERVMSLKPMSLNSNLQFKCHCKDSFLEEGTENNFLMSFCVGKEKYLCDVKARLSNDVVIVTVLNLFHMQKRRNFRYTLPQKYDAAFKVNAIENQARGFIGRLIDISTEGCAIEITLNAADLSTKQVISAEVLLGRQRPIAVEGLIMNIRPQGDSHLVIGIQFNHLAKASEMKIITALTEIQRAVYLKNAA